jgi:hypothetical protein
LQNNQTCVSSKTAESTDRIATCLGVPKEIDDRVVKVCSGTKYSVLPPAVHDDNGEHVCRPDNPEDDVEDYRCSFCTDAWEKWQIEEAKKVTARMEEKIDPEQLLREMPSRTILRTCPGCNNYTARHSEGGSCAHMNCQICHVHWCWICRASFTNSGDCYRHMDEEEEVGYSDDEDDSYDNNENDSDENYPQYHSGRLHSDTYNVTFDTKLSRHPSDLIKL